MVNLYSDETVEAEGRFKVQPIISSGSFFEGAPDWGCRLMPSSTKKWPVAKKKKEGLPRRDPRGNDEGPGRAHAGKDVGDDEELDDLVARIREGATTRNCSRARWDGRQRRGGAGHARKGGLRRRGGTGVTRTSWGSEYGSRAWGTFHLGTSLRLF